jgi:UDP-N-acetylglucosamine 2-epimerase
LWPERAGVENLKKEGKPEERIFFVGHVMMKKVLSFRFYVLREGLDL